MSTADGQQPAKASRGRPRQPDVDARIMKAVVDELASGTYGSLRVTAVAERAGVAPTTVYRRYPSKLELVKAALDELAGAFVIDPDLPLEALIHSIVQQTVDIYARGAVGMAMVNLFADALRTPDLAQMHKEAMLVRTPVRESLRELQIQGRVLADVDVDILMDLFGAIIPMRLLFTGEPVPADLADRLTPILVRGVMPGRRRK